MEYEHIDQVVEHLKGQIRDRDERYNQLRDEFDSYRQKVGDAFREINEVAEPTIKQQATPPSYPPAQNGVGMSKVSE